MTAARKLNKLAASVAKLTAPLPDAYKPWGYTLAFDSMVRACVAAEWGVVGWLTRRGGVASPTAAVMTLGACA